MTHRRTFEGDIKKMELAWGTAEREAKEKNSWRNMSGCIILNGQMQKKNKETAKRSFYKVLTLLGTYLT